MPGTDKKTEIKFNQEHYDLLKRCSDKNDMIEWNELNKTFFTNSIDFTKKFDKLSVAHLENANFYRFRLQSAKFTMSYLKGATFIASPLTDAAFGECHLENTKFFMGASLKGATFNECHFEGAELVKSHLEGASFWKCHLEGVNIRYATCDGLTKIHDCHLNKKTDFRGVAIDNIQWGPGLKQLAEYINRRLNWIDWYKEHKIAKYPVRFFWECSDYGRCTQRILWTFTGLSLLFAGVYFMLPEILTGLTHLEGDDLAQPLYGRSLFWRSLYFSVVTMTTLGFGDIHANPQSSLGHGLLIFQVILGYVILGALVTRLSILFNSDGPSADFAKPNSNKNWIDKLKDWWKDGWGEGSTNL